MYQNNILIINTHSSLQQRGNAIEAWAFFQWKRKTYTNGIHCYKEFISHVLSSNVNFHTQIITFDPDDEIFPFEDWLSSTEMWTRTQDFPVWYILSCLASCAESQEHQSGFIFSPLLFSIYDAKFGMDSNVLLVNTYMPHPKEYARPSWYRIRKDFRKYHILLGWSDILWFVRQQLHITSSAMAKSLFP